MSYLVVLSPLPFHPCLKKLLSVWTMLSEFSIWLKRQSPALLLFCNFRSWLSRTPKLGNNTEQNVSNKKAEDQPSPFLETNALLFTDSIVPRESSCQQEGEILLSSVGSQRVLLALGVVKELLLGTESDREAQIGVFPSV